MLFGIGRDEVSCSSLRKVLLTRNPTLTLGLSDHCEGTVLIICNSENARRRGRVSVVNLVSSPFLLIPPI